MHSLTLLYVYLYLLRHATCFRNLFTINLLMVIVMVVFPFSSENNYFTLLLTIFIKFCQKKFLSQIQDPSLKFFLTQFSSATPRRPATTTRRSSPRLNTTANLKTQLACVNRCRQIAGNNVRTCTDRCNADQNSF